MLAWSLFQVSRAGTSLESRLDDPEHSWNVAADC